MQITNVLAAFLIACTSKLTLTTAAAVVRLPSSPSTPAAAPSANMSSPLTSEIKIATDDYEWGFSLFGGSSCDGFVFDLLGHGTRACQAIDVFHSWKANGTVDADKRVRFFRTPDCSGPTVDGIGPGHSADSCRRFGARTAIHAFDVVDV